MAGEADDIQSGKFGEEIVSPCHSYLWRNKVNLGKMEGGMEGGRDGGREGWREGGREGWMDGWMDGWKEEGKGERRK